jgi:hypothetical protein
MGHERDKMTRLWLRQMEHIHRYLGHRYSITVNQVKLSIYVVWHELSCICVLWVSLFSLSTILIVYSVIVLTDCTCKIISKFSIFYYPLFEIETTRSRVTKLILIPGQMSCIIKFFKERCWNVIKYVDWRVL